MDFFFFFYFFLFFSFFIFFCKRKLYISFLFFFSFFFFKLLSFCDAKNPIIIHLFWTLHASGDSNYILI